MSARLYPERAALRLMIELEELPEHVQGPIQDGEEGLILDGVNELFDNIAFLPEYPLPEAPPDLERRFWFEKPAEGESWLPWRVLPDDIFSRVASAAECARKIYQFNLKKKDTYTGATTLTPDAIRDVYRQEYAHCVFPRNRWAEHTVQFDLHDVYLCIEAKLVERYDNRRCYGSGEMSEVQEQSNEHQIGWIEPLLRVVGEEVRQEMDG